MDSESFFLIYFIRFIDSQLVSLSGIHENIRNIYESKLLSMSLTELIRSAVVSVG